MTASEERKLAFAIARCISLDTRQKLAVADYIVNTFLWTGKRRTEFLEMVETKSGLFDIREQLIRKS